MITIESLFPGHHGHSGIFFTDEHGKRHESIQILLPDTHGAVASVDFLDGKPERVLFREQDRNKEAAIVEACLHYINTVEPQERLSRAQGLVDKWMAERIKP